MTSRYVQAAAIAASATSLQHILLVDRDDLPREVRYAMGVAAIVAGFAAWAIPARAWEASGALLVAVGGAGLPVIAGYAARRRLITRRPGHEWPTRT